MFRTFSAQIGRQFVRRMCSDLEGATRATFPERGVNQVTLVGRIGQDPMRRGADDRPVLTFSLATNRRMRKDGAFEQTTDWHRVAVFKPNYCNYLMTRLGKGDRVFVNGFIQYDRYLTEDHKVTKTTTIVADDVIVLKKAANREQIEEPEEAVN